MMLDVNKAIGDLIRHLGLRRTLAIVFIVFGSVFLIVFVARFIDGFY